MEAPKLLFIVFAVLIFFIVPLLIRNRRQYYLGLSGFIFIFSTGWIFLAKNNGIMLADLAIASLLILASFSRKKFHWHVSPIGWPLAGICIWGVISSFFAFHQGHALIELTRYFRAFLLLLCIYHHIQSIKDLRIVLNFFLLGTILESILAIYQWKFGALGLWFLGERDVVGWRSTGTFYVPAFLANYLALALPLAFKMFLFYNPEKYKTTFFYGAAFIIGVIGLFASYGRSEWIGFAFAIACLSLFSLFYQRSKIRAKSMWALPLLIIALLLFAIRYTPTILLQFGSARRSAYEIRFDQFRIAQRIIRANPIFGVGLTNYHQVSRSYLTPEERMNPRQYAVFVHNSYLYISAELGLPAGFLLIFWLGSILVVGLRIVKSKIYHPLILNITLGIMGGILAILVVFTFSPDIHSYDLLYHLAFYSGIMMANLKLVRIAQNKKKAMDLEKIRINMKNQSENENNQLNDRT